MTRAKTNQDPFVVPGQAGPARVDNIGPAWASLCALCNAPMSSTGWRWLGRTRACKGGCRRAAERCGKAP